MVDVHEMKEEETSESSALFYFLHDDFQKKRFHILSSTIDWTIINSHQWSVFDDDDGH